MYSALCYAAPILYNYPMRFITLGFFIFLLISVNSAPAQERKVVATVDSTEIYLQDIGGSDGGNEGEIKFVDPDVPAAAEDIDSQIAILRKLIKEEVLRREISERGIEPTEAQVQKEVNAYAEQQWRLLFPNPEKKKEVLARMQNTGLNILQAITIWKQDKDKGNAFAKEKLEPLGMNQKAWSFYTDHADDPEILDKLKKWEHIDTMSDEEIKEFLFLTNNVEHRQNIKFILSKDILKNSVIPERTVSNKEVKRLFDLLDNTQWIDIIIIPATSKELTLLGPMNKEERKGSISKELKEKKIRLPRSGGKDSTSKPPSMNEYMVLASNIRSLDAGSLSSVIKWPDQGKGSSDFAIYVSEIQTKDTPAALTEPRAKELNDALQRFKREQAYINWLNGEIALRTKILIPEYRDALPK